MLILTVDMFLFGNNVSNSNFVKGVSCSIQSDAIAEVKWITFYAVNSYPNWLVPLRRKSYHPGLRRMGTIFQEVLLLVKSLNKSRT